MDLTAFAKDVELIVRLSGSWGQNVQTILAALQRVRAETREADAELLDDLARDAEKTPGVTSQEQALMKGAVAAYRSGAAALRAQV